LKNISDINTKSIPVIEWMITEKCNYNCLHCLYAADNASSGSEWTLEDAKKLLDEAQECGIRAFVITGGEPLLHKYFFEIAENICRRNMLVQELDTNGQFISQNILDWLKEIHCHPLINISFDGVGCHDWLRNQQGAEQEALQTIHLCLENGFQVKVTANVNRQNITSLLSTAQLMDEMGVYEMHIVRTMEYSRLTRYAAGICLEQSEYYGYMLKFLDEYIKSGHNMGIDIQQMISLSPKQKEYHIPYKSTNNPCCQKIILAADGTIFSCPTAYGFQIENSSLGNAKTESLRVLLERWKDFSYAEKVPDCCLFFKSEYCEQIRQLASDCKYSCIH